MNRSWALEHLRS